MPTTTPSPCEPEKGILSASTDVPRCQKSCPGCWCCWHLHPEAVMLIGQCCSWMLCGLLKASLYYLYYLPSQMLWGLVSG